MGLIDTPLHDKPESEITLQDIMQYVSKAMKIAGEYKLEVEVISTAFDSLKEDPTQSIYEALNHGLAEWIK